VAVYGFFAVASGRLVVAMVGGGGAIIVNASTAVMLAALPLNDLALSVPGVVSVIAIFLYVGELLVGSVPSNV